MSLGLQNFDTAGTELLTGCRFYMQADPIEERPLLAISGLSVECPPAGGNANFGSHLQGQKMRQATPTSQKFEVVGLKVVASSRKDLFDWYTACNNEMTGVDWQGSRELVNIYAYDQAGNMQAHWQIQRAYPCKYSGPEFESTDENMANEAVDIVHEGIIRLV